MTHSQANAAAAGHVPPHADAHGHGGHDHHLRAQESIKKLGFWIFLVTDCVLFATIFATFAVLRLHTAGGPEGKELFEIPLFVAETFILLTSSYTSGLAVLAQHKKKVTQLIGWLVVTAVLGLAFLGLEVKEFMTLVHEGVTISTSAYWTAFFTLVGTHGLHVSLGIIWMTAIMIQVGSRGLTPVTERKLFNVTLYWHFLDVIWIFLFTIVYLMGVM
ncbi:cytochrome o ubiquinol oxidase subunit III [Paenibacillus sp. HJGM_3]|uniref:cytochrome o ubiquinol oxidase subunit III n=1 Tax=Paenibacillus sp. HJGM_3 TaxID=3379816 RepID=UPI00385EC1A8